MREHEQLNMKNHLNIESIPIYTRKYTRKYRNIFSIQILNCVNLQNKLKTH